MQIMQSRCSQLKLTQDTLNETGIPLVIDKAGTLVPAGYTDDIGIYYFIPSIGKYLGISTEQAINVFFGSLLIIGALVSICCFFYIFNHKISRFVSLTAVGLLTFAAYKYSDVYILGFFAVATLTPLYILWSQKCCKLDWKFILTLAMSGIVIGYSNLIRSHAGTGTLIFIALWLACNKELLRKEKLASLFILVLFVLIPYQHFRILEFNRDQFLKQVNSKWNATRGVHPKWHSIYIGLGYLDNKYEIKYNDSVAYHKAVSINPDVVYCSREYEQILRDQCILLAKTDPVFILKNICFKSIVLFFRYLQFANFGILLALFYIKPSLRLILPFLIASAFYAISGVLTIPIYHYVSGMTSMATLFGIYMICLSIEKYYKTHPRTTLQATNL